MQLCVALSTYHGSKNHRIVSRGESDNTPAHMSPDPRIQKFKEAFKSLNEVLDSFKNSEGSELTKDLKFYKTVFGKITTPAINNTMVTVHNLEEQLNGSFLPKRYSSGNVKIFNNHQLEMIDNCLDPTVPITKEVIEAKPVQAAPQRNKFLELQQNSSRNRNNVIKPKTMKTFVREKHPHSGFMVEKVPIKEMYEKSFDEAEFLERTLLNVPLHWIDTEEGLKAMYEKLKGEQVIAVDLEHHSFHSYIGLVSLIQISSSTEDFLIDPIRLRESLQSEEFSLNCVLADGNILKLFHGAESDISWLQRDFDTFIVNMFDSYYAARILNLPRMSLAYLLEQFCGVELDKKYQLADWRERPLSDEMIEYARKDTHYLHHLYHLLKKRLTYEQYVQVIQKSNNQCLEMYKPEPITDKSWRVVLDRSNFALNAEQVSVVRRLFYWREWKAKELDVSPAALMPNSFISRIAHSRAQSVADLKGCLRNVSDLLSKEFPSLSEYLQSEESKESEITGITESKEAKNEQLKGNAVEEKTHIRFNDEAEVEPVGDKTTKTLRTGRGVSFIKKSEESTLNIFNDNPSSAVATSKILLAGLVKPIQPVQFITREEEKKKEELEKKEQQQQKLQEEQKEAVKVVIHGRNEVVEDLEIVSGGSNSTALADKLRKNVKKRPSSAVPAVVPVDYIAMRAEKEKSTVGETEGTAEIFDPYNTINTQKEDKAAFIEAKIAPATGPRLSATRMSGNRMAIFTKKSKKN